MSSRPLRIAQDIVPFSEFKTHASARLRALREHRRPLVITQDGTPAAVVLTPEDYDEFEALRDREWVRAQVQAGLESLKDGSYTTAEVRTHLSSRRRKADAG